MKLQKSITKKFRSSRVKAIEVHPTKSLIVCGLYNGYVQAWDSQTQKMINESHVSEFPIRSIRIIEKNDCVLIGTDEGKIHVYDLGNLRRVVSFDAHNDFIRRIEVHPVGEKFLTCSDDGTIKRWKFGKDIKNLGCYAGHSHFVMDVKYYPKDTRKFLSCSLDGTIKLWDTNQNKAIKTFKGHVNGINAIEFIPNGDYFASASDDLSIKIWDINNTTCISTLTGHGENVVNLCALNNKLVSSSEDGSIKLWDTKSFQLKETLRFSSGRVWDCKEKGATLVIGTDENLIFMDVQKGSILTDLKNNKAFYVLQNQVYSCKLEGETFNSPKLLAELDYFPLEMKVSENGKSVALVGDDSFSLYSSLGFRRKLEGPGSSFSFISNTNFLVLDGCNLNFYDTNKIVRTLKVDGIKGIFYLKDSFVGVFESSSTFYDLNGTVLGHLDYPIKSIEQFEDFLIVTKENGVEVLKQFVVIKEFPYKVESQFILDNIYVFSSDNKLFYLLVGEDPFVTPLLPTTGLLVGIVDFKVYFLEEGKLKMATLDGEFINFQLKVLSDPTFKLKDPLSDSFRLKAISFYESLNRFDNALEICTNENYKFELLLKLNRLDEAYKVADTPLKFERLAFCFLKTNLKKASDCFYKAKDYKNLLFADLLSSKKYLKEIAFNCQKEGFPNYALIANLKLKDYKKGSELLKDSPFYNIFCKTYLQ